MNQGRIWCVVHPTVGLPLLLGSVAITALIVHFSVLSHVTWFGNYWQGKAARVAENATPGVAPDKAALAGYSVTVTPVPATGTTQAAFMISLSPAQAAPVAASDTTTKTPDAAGLREAKVQ
jgi:light-harvesting protein B-800-850 alpha chain